MMTEIKKIERYTDIMFAFEPKVRYFAEVEAADGAVFCAYKEDEPIGIAALRKQTNAFDTAYLYVKEPHRQRGVAGHLMEHAAVYAESRGKRLRLRVLENNGHAPVFLKIAKSLNMQPDGEMTFFKMEVNEQSKRDWEDYLPKVLEIITKIEKRQGKQQVISFAEADRALLNRLRDKIGSELPGLNPFALPDMNPEFSFMLVQNGDPAAFNAARTVGDKMVYEISAAQGNGKGTMIHMAPRFFSRLFSSDIKRVSGMIYSDNQAGLNHANRRFGFLFKESGRQTVYIR